MPKRVDHDARQRQITDAFCRIAEQDGIGAATFRRVAAEAGTSVRLVQYYFGTKDRLLEVTKVHVGERSIARLGRWIADTDGSPREVLAAFLKSFIPSDDESRSAMLMYIAFAAHATVGDQGPTAARKAAENDRQTETQMMHAMVAQQLNLGATAPGINPEAEAAVVTAMMPGLGNYVLDGTMTTAEVYLTIDYHLDRIFDTNRAHRVSNK